ncbi:MAG: hypothetical protein ABIO60_13120 [Aquaticitalea sp.]
MNEDLNPKTTEEIDLGQIFNVIGRLFDKFFKFIASIFLFIFSFIVYFLKAIIQNLILIAIVVIVAFIIGVVMEKSKPSVYEASMLVKPYFDSKYQLITNVKYYNSLLNENNHEVLSKVFHISKDESEKLVGFSVEIGPETKNELLKQYDVYLKSLDSSRVNTISFNEFVDNRDIYSSELYLITVQSLNKNIFSKLEDGFDETFSNRYSIEQKRIRDSTLDIRKSLFEKDLVKMDTLQSIYLGVVKAESDKGAAFINVQGLLPLQQEKSKTYEYELFREGMRVRDSIRSVVQLKVEKNTYYDVLSRFPEVGSKSTGLLNKYWFTLPVMAFILLCLIYAFMGAFKFIKDYES